jgi:hypothetical protein
MEGQFLVRQIYEDEITYNLINAAVDVLRKLSPNVLLVFTYTSWSVTLREEHWPRLLSKNKVTTIIFVTLIANIPVL